MAPKNLLYTRDHQWIKKTDNNRVMIGITDCAQKQLGDIVYVDLPAVGQKVSLEDTMVSIESVQSTQDFHAPCSGEVMEVNDELQFSPELVNQDPFGKGWIAIVEVGDPAELAQLLSANQYGKLVGE